MAAIGLALMFGVGCGNAKPNPAPAPPSSVDPTAGQELLDAPGVPIGTYRRSMSDIDKAKQAESNWQAQIKP